MVETLTELEEREIELPMAFAPAAATSARANLYRTIWRWHFYAGIFVAPILLVASITGALYVFIHELKPIMYPELMTASSSATSPRSLDELVAATRAKYPQGTVVTAAQPRMSGLNAEIGVRLPEGFRVAFVDPSTAKVAGLYDEQQSFFGIVLGLHRRLLAGSTGRLLVELSASWSIVLLVTGFYLWYPRKLGRTRVPGAGVWFPRMRASLNVLLRDWHAVLGFYSLGTAAFILITGLFFTQLFGPGFNWINKQVHGVAPTIASPPRSSAPAGRQQQSLEQVMVAAERQLVGEGPVRVFYPAKEEETFRVSRLDWSNPTWKSTAFIDAYSGECVAVTNWDDAAFLQKVRLSVYPIHVGEIFGMPTKILALLTCLVLATTSITGVWMWWRKRPRGTWGMPRQEQSTRISGMLIGSIVLLGVLLPAMGASLIMILTGEAVWRRVRRQPLAHCDAVHGRSFRER